MGKREISGRHGSGQARAHPGSRRDRGALRVPAERDGVQKPQPVQVRGVPFGDGVPETSHADGEAQRCVTGDVVGLYTMFCDPAGENLEVGAPGGSGGEASAFGSQVLTPGSGQ